MNVLWAAAEPLTARAVLSELGDPKLAYTTVKTVLDRLHTKRLVHREPRHRAWSYHPVGSRDDHVAELMLQALDRTGNRDGALVRFVRGVSPTDAAALRDALASDDRARNRPDPADQ